MRARFALFAMAAALSGAAASSCSEPPRARPATPTPPPPDVAAPPPPRGPRTLTILSINDLHGRIEALPLFAAYVANVRAARAADGGGVLVLDGGDMFQGTLESNLGEGAAVVDGYAPIGFSAAAVGNHEFDFGPVGPAATPTAPGDDPRGALFARAKSASFPFLLANVKVRGSGAPLAAPNLSGTVTLDVAGARVGVLGLTTAELLHTTISGNVADLEVEPLAVATQREATRLRAAGAEIVVAVAHAGGKCAHFTGDVAADGCQPGSEAFELARALPPGTIDAFVGGHTHAGVAHVVNGVPIVEAFSYGTHFGRIDLEITGRPAKVVRAVPAPPRELCPGSPKDPRWATCDAGTYEGRGLTRDARVAAAIAPHLERAAGKKASLLGVQVVGGPVKTSYGRESALGNLVADLLLEARPGATVALMNGGGLRADLPEGELTYGALFQAFPFDNRLGSVKVPARELAGILARNLASSGGILSIAGATAEGRCEKGKLVVDLFVRGKKLAPEAEVLVLTSDFLLTGGDSFWGGAPPPSIDEGTTLMRDVLEQQLKKRPRLDGSAGPDPKAPRLRLPGARPVRCGDPAKL